MGFSEKNYTIHLSMEKLREEGVGNLHLISSSLGQVFPFSTIYVLVSQLYLFFRDFSLHFFTNEGKYFSPCFFFFVQTMMKILPMTTTTLFSRYTFSIFFLFFLSIWSTRLGYGFQDGRYNGRDVVLGMPLVYLRDFLFK